MTFINLHNVFLCFFFDNKYTETCEIAKKKNLNDVVVRNEELKFCLNNRYDSNHKQNDDENEKTRANTLFF